MTGKELAKVEQRDMAKAYALVKTNPATRTMVKNAKMRASVVRKFLDWYGGLPEEVTNQDVADWRAQMEAEGLAKATVYQRISILSQFFEFLISEGVIEFNPVPKGKWRNGIRPKPYSSESVKALTAEELVKFLDAIDRETVAGARLYAMVKVIMATGMRAAEVCGIRWNNTKLGNGRPTVRTKVKGGEWRTFEITEEAREAIRDYLAISGRKPRGKQALFASIRKRKKDGRLNEPMTPYYLYKQIKRVAKRAGIEDMTIHMLRHTVATLGVQAGFTAPEIQGQLGHADLKTTQGYIHALAATPAKVGKGIEELLEETRAE